MVLLDKLADLECTGPVFDQNLRMLAGTPRRAMLCKSMDQVFQVLQSSPSPSFLSRRRHATLNNAFVLVSVLGILR